jgi:hypothetical protein
MNVFEDLIIELKAENLLERTVIDPENHLDDTEGTGNGSIGFPAPELEPPPKENFHEDADPSIKVAEKLEQPKEEVTDPLPKPAVVEAPSEPAPAKSGKEFFQKRALNELSGLQMVEHVITGVEREHMKVVPRPFDDLNAKKALHEFVNIPAEPETEEYKAADHALMQEIEAWCMALTERDKHIAVSNLRRYCENSKPALSSQALLALARFYRNSPYSEAVRAKFDFVITRLFSRSGPTDQRVCLFDRNETIGHINTLYSDWSSVSLYTADDDQSNVLLTGLSFDDLAAEAESAGSFDQLIGSDFFGRLRLFKESISELFYAPNVTAAAIESNIRIGNAYIKLLENERQKMDAASLDSKFGELDHQVVSDITGRTLDLAELMRQRAQEADVAEDEPVKEAGHKTRDRKSQVEPTEESGEPKADGPSTFGSRMVDNAKNVNRWLIAAAVLMVLLTIGLYIWANYVVEEKVPNSAVLRVDLDPGTFAEFIKTGKVSGDTFYGLLQPAWDSLPKDKRQDFLKKVLEAGKEKGYRQVTLIDKDGKNAGFASDSRVEVIMP